MFLDIWRKNKGVFVSRSEILNAYMDLLRYYETAEETSNTKAVKNTLKEILNYDNNIHLQ